MRVIKYGTPMQVLHVACDCGCEYELYDNEIRQHCGQEEVKTFCPTCGFRRDVRRDDIQVLNYCIGNRCARLTCDGADCTKLTQWMTPKYCPWCGTKIKGEIKHDEF